MGVEAEVVGEVIVREVRKTRGSAGHTIFLTSNVVDVGMYVEMSCNKGYLT